jgi:hypothetical protein
VKFCSAMTTFVSLFIEFASDFDPGGKSRKPLDTLMPLTMRGIGAGRYSYKCGGLPSHISRGDAGGWLVNRFGQNVNKAGQASPAFCLWLYGVARERPSIRAGNKDCVPIEAKSQHSVDKALIFRLFVA